MVIDNKEMAKRCLDVAFFMKYDNLFLEVDNCIGRKIQVSLVIGNPDVTEIVRTLKDVSYIETVHGISVVLEMEESESKEIVSLLIPNIINAQCDRVIEGPKVSWLKYCVDCHNHLLDYAFIESDFSKRTDDYFNNPIGKSQRDIREYSCITGRIFIED